MEIRFISEGLLRDFRQPEYIHVLLNPLPVYGLLVGLIGLVLALILKSRRAQIVHASRCRGGLARRGDPGTRDLHRLCWWKSPPSRISKRNAAAEEIRIRALASLKR